MRVLAYRPQSDIIWCYEEIILQPSHVIEKYAILNHVLGCKELDYAYFFAFRVNIGGVQSTIKAPEGEMDRIIMPGRVTIIQYHRAMIMTEDVTFKEVILCSKTNKEVGSYKYNDLIVRKFRPDFWINIE